jgi:hypothetical protein
MKNQVSSKNKPNPLNKPLKNLLNFNLNPPIGMLVLRVFGLFSEILLKPLGYMGLGNWQLGETGGVFPTTYNSF